MTNDATNALARAMAGRSRQVPLRLVIAIIWMPLLQAFTGWVFALAWFFIYAGLQLLERVLYPVGAKARSSLSAAQSGFAIGLVVVSSTVYGACGLAQAITGGTWGVACAALLFSAILVNGVLTAGTSRACAVATLVPTLLYLLSLPLFAFINESDPKFALALAASVAQTVLAGLMAWRVYQGVLAGEREARSEAEAATAAKSVFVATVSHELRTPITAIMTGAALLRARVPPAEQGYAELIVEAGDMMKSLLNDLLDVSKIEAGRLSLETLDFDLRKLVYQTLLFWQGEADRNGLKVRLEGARRVPRWVRGDPHRLRQILNNLFSNALKFTERGSVTLAIIAPNGVEAPRRQLQVRDTGAGMSPEQAAKLFQPFEQLSVGTARTHGGTGLGLSISRNLAQLMGGELTASSVPGLGSTFELAVDFPCGRAEDAARVENEDVRSERRVQALVVDDHAINRRALLLILEAAGCSVDTVESGVDALAALETCCYDVVLMDVNLGAMDGRETTRRLRAVPGPNQDIPIIGVTGMVGAAQLDACLDSGMNLVVTKPVAPRELLHALDQLLAAPEEAAEPQHSRRA